MSISNMILQRGVSYEWLLIVEFEKIYTDDISL